MVTIAALFTLTIVIGGDDFFDGLIPTWIVTKERSSWCFYLFKSFIEYV